MEAKAASIISDALQTLYQSLPNAGGNENSQNTKSTTHFEELKKMEEQKQKLQKYKKIPIFRILSSVLIKNVFSLLTIKEIIAFSYTCKPFYHLIISPAFFELALTKDTQNKGGIITTDKVNVTDKNKILLENMRCYIKDRIEAETKDQIISDQTKIIESEKSKNLLLTKKIEEQEKKITALTINENKQYNLNEIKSLQEKINSQYEEIQMLRISRLKLYQSYNELSEKYKNAVIGEAEKTQAVQQIKQYLTSECHMWIQKQFDKESDT